jgi:GNAT superfamily N-acetyltransferase
VAISIRRAVDEDWQILREIRLAALQESPSAFGSSYAREAEWTESEWREWTEESKKATEQVVFLAFDDADCVGLAGGYDNEGTTVRVMSMWVAPRARGLGIGEQLVDAIVAWARTIGQDTVDLWVTEGNEPAEKLYRRKGFEPMDDTRPLPSDERYQLRRMELRLEGTAPAT